jgi:dTDP-4-amino-4,6-dideoxygalactose transaminase
MSGSQRRQWTSVAPVQRQTPAWAVPVARPRLPALAALAPYIQRIDDGRRYSNHGPLCEEFEARLAARFGVEAAAVATLSNATVGLDLSLKAAGARPGGYCLLPSWTFSASVHAALEAGLIPFFVDVDDLGLLTPALAREAIAASPGEVGAVMPVAVWGQPIDPDEWDAFSRETGIPVVIDAAPAFDSARAGEGLTAVSLHATKVLGVGEGGFVLSKDADLVADVRLRGNFGFLGSREARVAGTNGKLSEYAAAVGLAALDEADLRRAAFCAAAMCYQQELADVEGVRLPEGWGSDWITTTCVARLHDPGATARVLDAIHAAGAETRAWWGEGMHTHPAFREYPRLDLPKTRHLAGTVIGLPFFVDIAPHEIATICEAIRLALA